MLRICRNSYTVHMSPTLSRSSTIRHFEHSDAIEIYNEIIFDFYTGLSHTYGCCKFEIFALNTTAFPALPLPPSFLTHHICSPLLQHPHTTTHTPPPTHPTHTPPPTHHHLHTTTHTPPPTVIPFMPLVMKGKFIPPSP